MSLNDFNNALSIFFYGVSVIFIQVFFTPSQYDKGILMYVPTSNFLHKMLKVATIFSDH